MYYQSLIFLHVMGITILGGALILGQVHQIRARKSKDVRFIAETYRTLYLTIIPWAPAGGLTILLTGIGLAYRGGFQIEGWLLALLILFVFEALEGITHYIPHAWRLMNLSREAEQKGIITPELDKMMNSRLANFMLYLDIPNFLIIAVLATFKPL